MLDVNPFDGHVAARLLDFFNSRTPWHRWLWVTGIVLTLKQVLEASEAVQARALTEASLRDLCETAVRLARPDPGVGPTEQKALLIKCLKTEMRFNGFEYLTVQRLTEDIEQNYLNRWAAALGSADSRRPERAARAIASHLLDSGLSTDFLHRWWTFKIRHQPGAQSLAEAAADAHSLARRIPRDYEVLIAFDGIPESESGKPQGWLGAHQVAAWLRTNDFDVSGVKQNGGVVMKLAARDPWSAVEASAEKVDRIAARVALGTQGRLTPVERAWVKGEKEPFQLRHRHRGVEVRTLYREDQLYSDSQAGIVDAALELLAPLASSSPGPAVAGGWAAVKALLSSPGDTERVMAGDRMACLVACSFPRAELTALSYKASDGASLRERLTCCKTHRDRAFLVAEAIRSGADLGNTDESDRAAIERMRNLLADSNRVLHDIERHLVAVFRRLYRQRNLVLHWGRTDAVALRASIRTAAPIVGAGMDRVGPRAVCPKCAAPGTCCPSPD